MSQQKVLLIGSGGREHALAWKLAQSEDVAEIIALPGNPGIEEIAECRPVGVDETDAILEIANEFCPDLIVIGPENPIADGLSDRLRDAGFRVFAPSSEAGRLESEKVFAKKFMERHGIPTAGSHSFNSDELTEAISFLATASMPVVVKASGLAAGKGVVIAERREDAELAVREILSGEAFGTAGESIVIEEFMEGEEASIFAVTDGVDYILLAPSQDHKRIGEGDTGPNTGGMGAYAPAPIVTPELLDRIRHEIVEPTLRGMADEGRLYVGCLYIGLMISPEGEPRVVEYNCRFGDPETQVVLPLWRGDLFHLFCAATDGAIGAFEDPGSAGSAACVVLASQGYPGSYEKGKEITGLEAVASEDDLVAFHAGTLKGDRGYRTAGGRVLGVVAISPGEDLGKTVERAYEGVEMIAFPGMTFRGDIAHRALKRQDQED